MQLRERMDQWKSSRNHRESSGLTPCSFRDMGEQVSVLLGGGRLLVERLDFRLVIELGFDRPEDGAESEVALGIAFFVLVGLVVIV